MRNALSANSRNGHQPQKPEPDQEIPQNLEAERNVLGAMLLDNSLADEIFPILSADDFFDSRHGVIFSALRAVAERCHAFDVVILVDELRRRGDLEPAGGFAFVAQLEQFVFSTGAAPEYAATIREKAQLRRLAAAAEAARNAALGQAGDSVTLADQLQAQLDAVRSGAAGADQWLAEPWDEVMLERPPQAQVVSGLFDLPSTSAIVAGSAKLKTMILLDLAVSVAVGRAWLPPLPGRADVEPFSTIAAPVGFVSQDTGRIAILERLQAVARTHGLEDGQDHFFLWSWQTPLLDATDARGMLAMEKRIKSNGIKLLIVDCLQTAKGSADENAAGEMGAVMLAFKQIAERAGCAVVLIHHIGKGDTFRGSTAIENLADTMLFIERPEGTDDLIFKPGKVRGAPIIPFGARFSYEHKPGTRQLWRAAFFGVPVVDPKAQVEERVLALIKEQPGLNGSKLLEALRNQVNPPSKHAVEAAVKKLLAGRRIYDAPGPNNSRTFFEVAR